MSRIGVIVGNGKLPLYFLREARNKGIDLFPIGLFDSVEDEIKTFANFKMFNIGQVGGIVKYFLSKDIKELVMLGKVEKDVIFKNIEFDRIGEEVLKRLPDRKDETLLFGVIAYFRLNGIKVLPQSHLMKDFVFKQKCYTKVAPTENDMKTIKIGIEAAKELSKVDAGQCVVCKDMSVVALEGIEGTDNCIKRGGELAGKDTIIVKMSRPQQDMRVDVPAIGISTVQNAISIGAKGLVCESKKMLFINEDECVKAAEDSNMFIIGI